MIDTIVLRIPDALGLDAVPWLHETSTRTRGYASLKQVLTLDGVKLTATRCGRRRDLYVEATLPVLLEGHNCRVLDLEGVGRAFAELDVPKGFRVEAAYAVGKRGDPSILPEKLRDREVPSPRLPLSAVAFEGRFRTE